MSGRGSRRLTAIISLLFIFFMSKRSIQVSAVGPDLRTDGIRGILTLQGLV